MAEQDAVLEFWLHAVGQKGWYEVDPAVDAQIVARFGDLWQQAEHGGLLDWLTGPRGALAYLILTDQFPRNMFRGDRRAFATDPHARAAASRAVAENWDQDIATPERQFFYLPFEHSEDPADQAFAVACFTTRMEGAETALHARAHQRIIQRFGRFPFRNAALGRVSTPAEERFIAEGGYGAIVRELQGEAS
jgi:uncharacterized protein (DUF924 family)